MANTPPQGATPTPPATSQLAPTAYPPSSSLVAAVTAGSGDIAAPITKPTNSATPSSIPPTPGPPPQAPTQFTTTKPKAKKSPKPSQLLLAEQPAATTKPPPASVPDPTLKDPVSRTNKIYYDLVFLIKAQGDLDAMAIQYLYLTQFLTSIHHVDETAVLLLYKAFFTLNEEVWYEPDKLSQSYTAVSKHFQGF